MSKPEYILFPVGRLVQGSLYEPQTTDIDGNPLVYKKGDKQGQPRVNFYFGFAIPKAGENHWSQTEWGAIIANVAVAAFPQGQAGQPTFAWKIIDGDSNAIGKPGRNGQPGKRPCDREGYPGHWVLNFSGSSQAPRIRTADGKQEILEKDFVSCGDWIQVYGSVKGNESLQQPGVYLTQDCIAFRKHGDPIIIGVDPASIGFGQAPMPPGAKYYDTPRGAGFNPAPPSNAYGAAGGAPAAPAAMYTPPPAAYTPPPAYAPPPAAAPMPAPHIGILTPPLPVPPPVPAPIVPPAVPARVMLPAANGIPYEEYIRSAWTDAMLIQHGMMAP